MRPARASTLSSTSSTSSTSSGTAELERVFKGLTVADILYSAGRFTLNVHLNQIAELLEEFGFTGISKEVDAKLASKTLNATTYWMRKVLQYPNGPVLFGKDSNLVSRAWYPRWMLRLLHDTKFNPHAFEVDRRIHADLATYLVSSVPTPAISGRQLKLPTTSRKQVEVDSSKDNNVPTGPQKSAASTTRKPGRNRPTGRDPGTSTMPAVAGDSATRQAKKPAKTQANTTPISDGQDLLRAMDEKLVKLNDSMLKRIDHALTETTRQVLGGVVDEMLNQGVAGFQSDLAHQKRSVDDVTARVEDVTVRIEDVTARVEDVTARVEDVTACVESFEDKIDELVSLDAASRIEGVEERVEELGASLDVAKEANESHGQRLDAVEEKQLALSRLIDQLRAEREDQGLQGMSAAADEIQGEDGHGAVLRVKSKRDIQEEDRGAGRFEERFSHENQRED